MQNNFQISKVIIFDAIASTNLYIREQSKTESVESGTVIRAHYQSLGKGQRSNHWESNPNENLLFSIFYQPKHIKVEQQFFLNMAVSVAIVEVFKEFEVDIKIKWPNDILIKNKKISGILVENTIQGNLIISSIIGIGINVNQTIFEDLPHASSLKNELDYEISIENLFNSTLESITQWINVFENQNFFKIKELYLKNLYGFEELKQFNKDGQFITAKIADIDMYGRIVLKENGRTKAFQFGEIHQMYQ